MAKVQCENYSGKNSAIYYKEFASVHKANHYRPDTYNEWNEMVMYDIYDTIGGQSETVHVLRTFSVGEVTYYANKGFMVIAITADAREKVVQVWNAPRWARRQYKNACSMMPFVPITYGAPLTTIEGDTIHI